MRKRQFQHVDETKASDRTDEGVTTNRAHRDLSHIGLDRGDRRRSFTDDMRQKMGRYHILRLIGEGGMGTVFEAYDPELARKVAIKVIHPRLQNEASPAKLAQTKARLVREAKSLAKVAHPNVIPIYDVGLIDDDSIFMAMEYVPGLALHDWLAQKRPSWSLALSVMMQAGEGLVAAYGAGLLHRDIKPANIMVGDDGGVRVLDFGLAKSRQHRQASGESDALGLRESNADDDAESTEPDLLPRKTEEDVSQRGAIFGTPAYLAPELLRGTHPGKRSELFSFATVLYEALTGKKPFPTDPPALRQEAIVAGRLSWPASVPKWLRRHVESNLRDDPRQRSEGIAELLREIDASARLAKRLRATVSLTGALVLPLVVGVAWAYHSVEADSIDPDCRESSADLEPEFSAARLDAAKQGFLANKLGAAKDLWANASSSLNEWRTRWMQARRHLCPAFRQQTREAPFDSGQREQARACLDESKREIAALLQVWQNATTKHILDSGSALNSLSEPMACTDLEALRKRRPLPADPKRRRWLLEQHGKVKSLRFRIEMADYSSIAAELDAIEIPRHSREDYSLLAEVTLAKGRLAYRLADATYASSMPLFRAFLWATAADHPLERSETAKMLWFARVYRSNLTEEMEEHLRNQEASMVRAGSPNVLKAEYERNLAIAQAMQGKLVQTQIHLANAIAILGENVDYDRNIMGLYLEDEAETEYHLGRIKQAIAVERRSRAMHLEIFPAGHPKVARSRGLLAHYLYLDGKLVEGYHELSVGSAQCLAAEVPVLLCVEALRRLPRLELAMGNYQDAIGSISFMADLEALHRRRLDPERNWATSDAAEILLARGEVESARKSAMLGLHQIRTEGTVRPSSEFYALISLLIAEIESGDRAATTTHFAQAKAILDVPNELGHEMQRDFSLALAYNQLRRTRESGWTPALAVDAAQQALAAAMDTLTPPQDLARAQLMLANALRLAGEFDLAHYYAVEALARHESIEGLRPHLLFPYYETLAALTLEKGELLAALEWVEKAHESFDPAQVLDTRLASVHFIEAKIRWNLAQDDPAQRRHAESLAERAWLEFRASEGIENMRAQEVEQWLVVHDS
jgi:serine/threonine protein kinase